MKSLRTTWLINSALFSLLLVTAAHGQTDESGRPSRLRTSVYECTSGETFVVNVKDEKAWIFLPRQTVSLDPVSAESGVKYSDGTMTFWSNGEEAVLETPTKRYSGCRNNRAKAIWEDAKLRGVDFRAVGNEPGWYLEIREGTRLLFVADYGQSTHEFAISLPSTDHASRMTTYSAQKGRQRISVLLEGRACSDTMSGERFDTTVTVELNGKEYRGCGRALH